MTEHENMNALRNDLMKAIEEDKGIADIFKDKSKEEIKEVLLATVRETYPVEHSILSYAIHKKNDQAIKDILQIAQKNKILETILNSAVNDLHKAIIRRDEETISKWVDHLFSKHRDATFQIFKTVVSKYMFTQEETDKLVEKVNEGKYGEVINIIRKRQAFILGIGGIVLTAVAIGVIAGAILGGTAAGLTVGSSCVILTLGAFCSAYIINFFNNRSGYTHVAILVLFPVLFPVLLKAVMVAVGTSGITAGANIAVLPIAIGGVIAAVIGFVGISMLCRAISNWSNEIEVSDKSTKEEEVSVEKNSTDNGLNKSEVSTEEQPNAEINQINLEKGTGRKEGESIDNGSMAAQHSM